MINKYDYSLTEADCRQIEFALSLYIDSCDEILSKRSNEHVSAAREHAIELRRCFKAFKTFESHE